VVDKGLGYLGNIVDSGVGCLGIIVEATCKRGEFPNSTF
jgi:FAD/FMN-containing dehydrogenase